jgi:integrase
MARQLKRLTSRTVATLTKVGRHADGGCLYLAISKTDGGLSKRWTFMFALAGKQREAGFGSASIVTLAEAREKAAEWRSMLAKGIDPLDAKKAARESEATRKTFGQCADELTKSKRSEWRNATHARQWRQTLNDYCGAIWNMPVDAIDTPAVLSILKPVWATKPETASRLRGRIEATLDYAKAHRLRTGENPATWKGNLALILPRRQKLSRAHLAALPYREVVAFLTTLRESESVHAMGLEFGILTAARLGEVLGAQWAEIDLAAKTWTVPGNRMKSGLEHRVPLSARAMEIVGKMAEVRTGDFVFPGQRRGRPLSQGALRKLCPSGATIHGFRSSFRDWCGEETNFPREIAERCLAHKTGNAVEEAYRRGDALGKRRALMDAWAAYVEPGAGGNVIPIRSVQ